MAEEKIESNDNFNFKEGQNPYVPLAPMPSFSSSNTGGGIPKMSFDDVVSSIPTRGTGVGIEPIMASQLPSSSRYKFYYPGRDPEEMMAQQQGSLEKWGNGLIKFAGTTTTSFLGGTLGAVYGLTQYAMTGKFSSLYNNPVNRKLDDVNLAMEDYAPNFYTTAEKDAAWYSGNNILTANFWSDKVLKNLGYSIGSIGAGVAWGGVLGAIGLTNRLVAAGRGLEAATAVEQAIATASPIQRFGALRGALTATSNQYLKNIGAKALINADRGIVAAMGTMGEASFESIQNMNSTRDKMIQNFVMKNGYSPTGDDLEEINNYAEKVGDFTWGMNVALLTATNYIQLPKILNSSKTLEKFEMNNIVKESLETGAKVSEKIGAKYIADKTVAAKIGGKVGNILDKYIAKPAGLLFAPIEAFEEGAQFAIQTGTDNYFSRAYDTNENVTNFWKNLAGAFDTVLDDGVKKALSTKEGLENILIGGISGGLQTSFSPLGQNTLKERGVFGTGGTRAKNTQIAIDAINNSKNLNQVLQDGVKYANIGINSQQMRQEAVANDDTLSEKDYEQDYALSYIMPRVKYGKTDSIKEDVGLYRQQALTEEGFAELKADGIVLENEDRSQFLQRLENIMRTTEQVQKMYDMFNNRYSSILDEKNERVYSDAAIERMVYASAKVFDYDGRLGSLQPKLAEQGLFTTNIDEALKNAEGWEEGDFEKILNNENVISAITEAVEPISKSKEINSDAVLKDFSDYIKLILYRKMYIDDFNTIKNAPQVVQDFTTIPTTEETTPSEEQPVKEQKETIKLTTQDGEEDIEIGTKYYLGRDVKKSATGKDVFFSPQFTVLGENEDGTIQIQDRSGVRSVDKENFANYKLGKVSDTLNNKKAKFFLEHWNVIYEHYGLKDEDGKPKKGRLRYSPKKDVLEFVFLNSRGEEESVEVKGRMFKPAKNKNYVHGLLKEVGKLTAEQAKAKEEFENETPTEEELVERPNKNKILGEMYQELTSRREQTDSLIEQKQKEVAKIKEELSELEKQIESAKTDTRVKKTVRFKSVTKKAISNAMRLSRMQDQLEKEIASLEVDREDIDIDLVRISDLLENIQDLPKVEKKFLQELEDHVSDLKDLQEKTGKQINILSKLLKQTEGALQSALDFIYSLINTFESKYPNVPRVMGQDYVDFLKANPNFLKLKPNYREDLLEVEDQIAFIDEAEVIPSENRLKDLNDHFSLMQESMNEIQSELQAYQNILDRFKEAHDRYKAQQKQQKFLQQKQGLVKKLVGTLENNVQNVSEPTKKYEAVSKKDDLDVVGGTTAGSEKDSNKPFNKRAQRFGFNFNNLPNNKALRGITVTANTENDILLGLTEHLVKGTDANPKTVIAMVMVAENEDGTYYLVDENGKAIPEGANLLDTAIYQVHPLDQLKAMYDGKYETMFRETTPKDVQDSLTEQYKAWREQALEQKALGMPEPIDSSFGIPEYVEIPTDKSDENGKTIMQRDYSARTPVEAAGLVTPSMLRSSKVITVATTNDSISNGTVTFKTPLGIAFLQVPGGLVKLFNRKFNNKEANVIFDVIQQLSSNVIEEGVVSDKSTKLINWLKSVVYWGIAKDPQTKERKPAGYNNIWFEEVLEDNKPVTKLFISGKGTGFNFDPESLEDNKELIIGMLEDMYGNTNATLANDNSYTNSYIQITGIDNAGEPIIKEWQNYQTYLLSSEGRTAKEIPLTTQFRPLSGPDDINRKGIYFKFKNTVDRFNTTPTSPKIVEKPQEKATPKAAPVVSDIKTKKADVEKEVLENLNRYAEPSSKEVEYQGDEDFTSEEQQKSNTTLGSIIDGFNSFPPTPYNFTSKTLAEFKEKVKEYLQNEGLEENFGNIISNIDKLVNEKLAALETKQEASAAPAKTEGLDLSGKTPNTVPIGRFGDTTFKLNAKLYLESNGTKGFEPFFKGSMVEAIMSELNKTEDEAKALIGAAIIQKVQPQLNAMALPKVAPMEEFTEEEDDDWDNAAFEAPDDKVYRLQLAKEAKQFEDWDKVESFLKEKFPMLPVYRIKNVIKATNGRQAFGFFQNGAIYLSENAEVGTVYHEVFHAVWRMFTSPEERAAIINEFKSREGSFIDYATKESVKYSEATINQIEEQLAEELRDLQLFGTKPVSAKAEQKSFIAQLLSDIVTFIKEFFTGKSAAYNVQTLFDKIGNGYYARYNPYETALSVGNAGIISIDDIYAGEGAQYRLTPIDIDSLIKKIPATQLHDIIQHMTYKTLATLVENKKSLFKLPSRSELYEMLKKDVLSTLRWQGSQYEADAKENLLSKERAGEIVGNLKDLYKNVNSEWDAIVQKYEQNLLSYSITFSEDDSLIIDDENKSGKEDYKESRKIDTYKKASAAIKLLTAAVPNVTILANNTTKFKRTPEGFISLVPGDVIFASLMSDLQTSTSIDQMLTTLRKMALGNPNYRSIYSRLTDKDATTPGISLKGLKKHYLQLVSAFWKTFKKQNPDVISVFILPNGEVVIGDGSLASASRQSKRELTNAIVGAVKTADKYFKYDEAKKLYGATSKLQNVKLDRSKLGTYIDFLNNLNIEFNESDLKTKLDNNQLKTFFSASEGILKSLSKVDNISTISSKTLDIDGQLLKLGAIKSIIQNPQFELTYFNADGERVQSSIGVNAMSNMHDALSNVNNVIELIGTPYEYLLTDSFSSGSELLNKIFDIEGDGRKRDNVEDLLKPSYIDSTINEQTGRVKDQSKYVYRDRIIQEINLNLSGIYSNLVPGDAQIGWTQRMYNEDSPFVTMDELLYNKYFRVFRNHLISEINLARENRNVLRDSDKLRFFRSILGKELADDITSRKNKDIPAEQLYDSSEYKSKIEDAISKFITDKANGTSNLLYDYGIIRITEEGLVAPGLSIAKGEVIDEQELTRQLKLHAANYIIANMELHKVLYSDPYQYKDELKRIKSFASPRQALLALSRNFNDAVNEAYNEDYKEGDIAYTNFSRDYFRTITMGDVLSTDDVSEDYSEPFEETDGGGYITLKANRVYGLHTDDWTDSNELQYQYDMAYEKKVKNLPMSKKEQEILAGKNPNDKSTYTPRKPSATGSKLNSRGYNDIVLDKIALVPLSFRILHELNPDSNAIKLYNKMQKEDIDYAVYESGRKVGAEKISQLYDSEGNFNESPFETQEEIDNPSLQQGVINIPFSIMGVQSEVPSKDEPVVTQGTQITEMVTMDLLQAGVPIDFKPEITNFEERFKEWNALEDKESYNEGDNLYKEIKNNQSLLVEKVLNGFENLKNKLGIVEVKEQVKENGKLVSKNRFEINDPEKLVDQLYKEVIKSGVNDNILYALNSLKFGKVVLEATPAYQYIRNLLFSLANREISSQKVSGGQKVQIPSSLLESVRAKAKQYTDKNGNVKNSYVSKNLKFYRNKDGQRVCQIMVSRWFNSNKTDAELLEYFNNTEEGQKILRGVAFRIPTQKQNSIDTFEIAQFLPEGFGDSVVIPSALVKKVGSDFDIDKLFIYLKNVYTDAATGDIKYVPFFGIGESAKAKFADMFDRGEFLTKEQVKQLDKYIAEEKEKDFDLNSPEAKLIRDIFPEAFTDEAYIKEFIKDLSKDGGIRQAAIDRKYTQSLQNEYFESLQKLISHPLNFERLVKPNSADQLKALSKIIVKATKQTPLDSSDLGNMLSFEFITKLRQAFVSGKYAIGIAAVGQKNHSQNQRAFVYIDDARLEGNDISEDDKKFLGDGKILFEKYNKLNGKPTLSFIKDANNENFISDVNGQFIDGYVDISKDAWIMELGATPNTAGTWLFLVKLGVPINTIAFFMNQPIVREYLRTLENDGYSWLFIEDYINDTLEKYTPSEEVSISQIPSEGILEKNLGKSRGEMNNQELAQQQLILKEFIKYSKMASHLYDITNGSNFDTATINDSFLVMKKMLQYEKAKKSIISSVDDILDNSYVKAIKDVFLDVRDAYSTILISDNPTAQSGRTSVRDIMEKVLLPYAGLSDRDFVKIANRAVNDLFDWAVQTDRRINTYITNVLLGKGTEKSAAEEIMNFKKMVDNDPTHPLHDNYIINSLRIEEGDKKGKINNLYLANKNGKSYDQNLLIYGFRQLKDGMGTSNKDLYGKLVRLAVLQSGLSNSPISFTTLLPYEDFESIYNETLSNLGNLTNLDKYYELGVLQRNNASNGDIVPYMRFRLRQSKKNPKRWFNPNTDFIDNSLENAMTRGDIPKVINISTFGKEGQSDYVTYQWELPISKEEKAKAKREKNRDYIKKALFRKVYTTDVDGNRIPLLQNSTYNGVKYVNFVYKHINAWGDSFRANEFYDYERPSKLDNGFEKLYKVTENRKAISAEVSDNDIVTIFDKPAQPVSKPVATTTREYTPENITSLKSNEVFVFGSNTEGRHGAGAAKTAVDKFGAKYGKAKGLQGQSYAIVTKDLPKGNRSVSLDSIYQQVIDLNDRAKVRDELKFYVTKFGTDLAGFTVEEIKQIWKDIQENYIIADNIVLPREFEVREELGNKNAPEGLPPINRSGKKC